MPSRQLLQLFSGLDGACISFGPEAYWWLVGNEGNSPFLLFPYSLLQVEIGSARQALSGPNGS